MSDTALPVVDYSKLSKEELAARIKENQRLIAQIDKGREEYLSLAPYLGFIPHPGQYRALQMIQKGVDSGKMKFGVFPGKGWGKTQLLMNLYWNIMCEPEARTRFFRLPFIVNWKWPKHLRMVTMAEDLKDHSGEVWKAIDQWWPKGEYETQKQDHPYISLYRHKKTGFIMDVRTFDQEPKQHESSTLGFMASNEPPPSYIWSTYASRFRKGGIMCCFATLVFESEFFKDDVIDNPNASYCFGDVHENCRQCSREEVLFDGTRYVMEGVLDHDQIEATLRELPKHIREAARMGRPVHLSGAAFAVDSKVHFVPREKLPRKEDCAASILALDPHQRRPWALVVVLKDAHGNYYVADEWPRIGTLPWKSPYHKITDAGVGHEFYAKAIREIKAKWGVRDVNAVIDAKFAGQMVTSDQHAQKLREILAYQYKLWFQAGHTAVRGDNGGIDAMKNLLAFDMDKPVDFTNRPRLYFCEDCWNVCHQMQNVTWDEMADPDRYGQKEVLDERYLDFPRLVMYAIMHRASHTKPVATAKELQRLTLEERWKKVSADFPPPLENAYEPEEPSYFV